MTAPSAFSARSIVLAMPDPTDVVTAEVFARWTDFRGGGGTFFHEEVIDGPDQFADTVQRAVTALQEYGYGVTREHGTLRVTAPIPAAAPQTREELAATIDPQTAQRVVANMIAEYGRHCDGWNGGDAVDFVGLEVSRAVDASLRPLLHENSAAVADYWNRIAEGAN